MSHSTKIVFGIAAGLAGIWAVRRATRHAPRHAPPSAYRPGEHEAWALVTGASSGMGEAFARRLASDGYHLTLVARRRERLEQLAAELRRQHCVEAEVLAADLACDADVERVARRAGELDRLNILVNGAGFGTVGAFAGVPEASQAEMVRLHAEAPVRLARAVLPGMLARKQGAIINISSVAAFFALPGNVTYCATKRFLNTFSEALSTEVAGCGVVVQALCPGFTTTEFHATQSFRENGTGRPATPNFMWMPAEEVVRVSLNELGRGVVCVPGSINRLIATVPAIVPSSLIGRAVNKIPM